jgi:hypothetical protein
VKKATKNQKYCINHEYDDFNDENDCNINDEDYIYYKPQINET